MHFCTRNQKKKRTYMKFQRTSLPKNNTFTCNNPMKNFPKIHVQRNNSSTLNYLPVPLSHCELFDALAESHRLSIMIGTPNQDQKVAFETVISATNDTSLPHQCVGKKKNVTFKLSQCTCRLQNRG